MNVAVGVNVIAPVFLAALVNRNDAVAVIDAVNEPATRDGDGRYRWHAVLSEALLERIVARLTKLIAL
jgi:hypothetical protein